MATPAAEEREGIERVVSSAPPAHFSLKIEAFSQLSKRSVEKYESVVFQAGGYKWKLFLYPNGNKNKNVKEHVSIYLSMVETSSHRPGWEVHAVFRLFLLDQNNDNYLILQDARRFHGMKLEWGFDRFVPLNTFTNARNGYLVDDACVFGAEVFVSKERNASQGENLLMIKDAVSQKYVWRINNFSNLDKEYHDSNVFISGNKEWKIRLYPNGKGNGLGSCISLYLVFAGADALPSGTKLFAEYSLRIVDQVEGRNFSGKGTHWFTASTPESGWARFIQLTTFRNLGTLHKDACIVEADVTVFGVVDPLS